MVPASPMPLAPSGLVGDGVTVRADSHAREVGRRRDHVVDERPREDLPALVVDGLLEQRLRDRLRDPAVHLALDDHRVDDVAAVVDRRVALDRRPCPVVGVDLDLGDVRAEREREVGRVEERRRLEVRLDAGGHRVARPGGEGELLDRLRALGRALDLPLARPPTRGRRRSTRAGARRSGAPCRAPSRTSRAAPCRRRPASASRRCRGRRATAPCRRGRPRPGRTGCRARSRRSATRTSRGPGRAARSR